MLFWVHGFRGFPWLLGYLQACGKDGHHGVSTWQRKIFILQWPRSNKRDKEGDGIPISSLKAYLGDIHNIWWWRLLSSIRPYLLRAGHFPRAPQTGDSAMCRHFGANIQGLNCITQDFCSLPPSQLFAPLDKGGKGNFGGTEACKRKWL